MNEIELKACPFCGSQAVIYFWQDEDLWSHNIVEWQKVRCTGCDCEGQSSCEGCEESETAVAFWNTRAPQWQPIESAPKDTVTEILAWDGYDMRVTHWCFPYKGHPGAWYESKDRYETLFWEPTHWAPLPAPPKHTLGASNV